MSQALTRILWNGSLRDDKRYIDFKQHEEPGLYRSVSKSGESINLTAKDKSEVAERSIIDALADYPRLKNVKLEDAHITDRVAEALLKLPELAALSLSTSSHRYSILTFDNLAFLREAKRLTSLYLYDTSPPVGISELRQLKSITADDNTLYDLSLLEPLQELEKLHLKEYYAGYSKIRDVSFLKHLPKLHSLELRLDGDKNDLNGFAELKQLKRLSVELNSAYDITPLGELTQLEELWLSSRRYRTYCPIPSIEALSGLVNLTVLSVCGVKLKSLEPVRNMKNLLKLYCSGNHIRTLKPLAGLVGLQALDISDNPIKDFTPIRRLPHYSKRWESMEETSAFFDLDIPPETSGLLFYIIPEKNWSTKRQVTVNPGETVELKEDERICLGDATDSSSWHMQKAAFKDFDAQIDLIMKDGPAFFLADYFSGERYMIYEDEGQRLVMPFDTGVSIPYDRFKPSFEIGIIGSLKINNGMERQASEAIKQCIAKLEEKRFWKQADIVIAQVQDIALRFMESVDMVMHLRKEKLPVKSSVDIIMASRASLSEKIAVLRIIRDMLIEVMNAFRYWCEELRNCGGELYEWIMSAEFELKETSDNTPAGSVFMLTGYNLGVASSRNPSAPFAAFKAAKKRLLKESAEYDEDERDCLHYVIEKWIPVGDGTMLKIITWYLSHKGAIWFAVINKGAYEHFLKYYALYNYKRMLEYKRNHELAWMTVPFEPGDIVTVDCRPTRSIIHAVISDISDSGADYRSIKCIYVTEGGKLTESSLNHDLSGYDGSAPLFTGMLNLTKFTGELPFQEMPLQAISEDIKRNPYLGKDAGYNMAEEKKK